MALGVNIYEKESRFSLKLALPWSEIRYISFNGLKLIIKLVEKTAPTFIFYTQSVEINKLVNIKLNYFSITYKKDFFLQTTLFLDFRTVYWKPRSLYEKT